MGRGSREVLVKNGWMEQKSASAQGPCGRKPSGESVDGRRGYTLLVFLSFSFLVSFSPIAFLVYSSWASFSLSLFSLFSLSLFSHNQPADRQTGAMMDDALSESDNIFSQSPKQDRAASEVDQRWPLSLLVRSNCCVQSPLSRPPYQLRWACANWS